MWIPMYEAIQMDIKFLPVGKTGRQGQLLCQIQQECRILIAGTDKLQMVSGTGSIDTAG